MPTCSFLTVACIMERTDFISECVTKAAEKLGYPIMKQEQLGVAIAFAEGRDVFAILQLGLGRVYATQRHSTIS